MAVKNEWAEKDYYADLGVSPKATDQEIKRAYRKLARENHPDSNPGNTVAEEKFKRVAEAYDVVGDETKRKEYDDFKAMLKSGGFRTFGQKAGPGFSGGFPSGAHHSYQATDFNIGDLFGNAGQGGRFAQDDGLGDFLGGIFNRGGGARNAARPSRGADVSTEITLEFREAAQGTSLPIQLTGEAPCEQCHGSGSSTGKTQQCGSCKGSGLTSEQKGAFGFSRPCQDCDGQGQTVEDPCGECHAKGTRVRTRSITVRIPPGVIDGQKVRLAGQGEAGPNGRPAGDLFVTVHVKDDPVFTRSGDDLEVSVPVSFAELALGDTIKVPTLDAPVRVRIPAGTPDGRVLRVRGRGVPKRGGTAGDLLVKVVVQVPSNLNAAATSALRTYAQAERDSGFNPRQGWPGSVN